MADVGYGSLPFSEQIDFFRRKLNQNTLRYTDVWEYEHDHAFMVAGANRADLVADFRAAIDKAIADGTTLADFRKDFDRIVAKYGWSYNGGRNWRSRVIYETNLRTSYAAGRYQQLQAAKKFRPYWQYVHSDAVAHPRPLHLAWNGLVLHADDPWWTTHFPPNGWGCQCTIHALNDRDLKRLGKDGPDTAPPDDLQTVTVGVRGPNPQTVQTPAGVDPGFGYTPGSSAFERLTQDSLSKTTQLPAAAAVPSTQEILELARVRRALDDGYRAFQAKAIAGQTISDASYVVGAIAPEVLEALRVNEIQISTAAIIARDAQIIPTLSEGLAQSLTRDELARLPAMLRDPRAVLLDADSSTLLYVYDSPGLDAGNIAVSINYGLNAPDAAQVANAFRSAAHINLADLRARIDSGALMVLSGTL